MFSGLLTAGRMTARRVAEKIRFSQGKTHRWLVRSVCVAMLITAAPPALEAGWNPYQWIKRLVTGHMVHDPVKYGEAALQSVDAVENFFALFKTLTGITVDLTEFEKVVSTAYNTAMGMEQIVVTVSQMCENLDYLVNSLSYNVNQYASLADAGWLTAQEFNNAIMTSTTLTKYAISQLGGVVDMVKSPGGWTGGDLVQTLDKINSNLSLAVVGSDALSKKILENAELRRMRAQANAARKIALGQARTYKVNGKKSRISYEDLCKKEMAKVKALNWPDRKFDDDEVDKWQGALSSRMKTDTAQVADNIKSNGGTVVKFAMIILCILGIIYAAIAGANAMIEGDSRRVVMVAIGFLLSCALLVVMSRL